MAAVLQLEHPVDSAELAYRDPGRPLGRRLRPIAAPTVSHAPDRRAAIEPRRLPAPARPRRAGRPGPRADGGACGCGARGVVPRHPRAPPARAAPSSSSPATRCGRSPSALAPGARPAPGRRRARRRRGTRTRCAPGETITWLDVTERRVAGRATARATGCYRGFVRCPYCRANDDKVVDSRLGRRGGAIRRRRECLACGRRFTTYERVEEVAARRAQALGRDRAVRPGQAAGRDRAGGDRAGSTTPTVDALVAEVEEELRADGRRGRERPGRHGRARAAAGPRPVAYLRFASVYKGFEDLADFEREVGELQKTTEPKRR